ncbi:hypothetical protein [Cupriavidus taiwanensis]|uniref:hypothetical protein n=1 Tax=Cupriavidus taiwanensis TaxID=164546 RepID=UPI000E1FC61E|nr:hypothetical protein [Cupriavidus taiwanensis]
MSAEPALAANSDVVAMQRNAVQGKVAAATAEPDERDWLLAKLRALQFEAPMMPLQLSGHVASKIVSACTGICWAT